MLRYLLYSELKSPPDIGLIPHLPIIAPLGLRNSLGFCSWVGPSRLLENDLGAASSPFLLAAGQRFLCFGSLPLAKFNDRGSRHDSFLGPFPINSFRRKEIYEPVISHSSCSDVCYTCA